MLDPLQEILSTTLISEKYRRLQTAFLLTESYLGDIFDEDEEVSPESAAVTDMIRHDRWEKITPEQFSASLRKSKHASMLTAYSPAELAKMKLFKLQGRDIGFALKNTDGAFNEIVAVHNNEPTVRGIGKELMNAAIRHGGTRLDHFDSPHLSGIYGGLGFQEYKREKYDRNYDQEGTFAKQYGPLDIVYRERRV